MAASITTQAHVLTYATTTDNAIGLLSTDRMDADNWAAVHIKAWTLIKEYLADRRPTIAESDIDDTDELLPATTYAAIYRAYNEAEFMSEEHQARGRYWFKRMRKELGRVRITVDGTLLARESFAGRRSLRA